MKNIFILITLIAISASVNGQNSKKIKVVDFDYEIEATCDNLPTMNDVSFETKCKEGGLSVDYTDKVEEDVCVSKIERTYTVSDECGNTASFKQLINVRDTEKPKFLVLPPNVSFDNRVEYINSPHIKFPQVFDNCSEVTTEEKIEDDYSNGQPQLKKYYIATDACGNQVTHRQIITFNIDH